MLRSIQILRGIAALMVVIYHSLTKIDQYSNYNITFTNIGYSGVDLFFIISGFIMFYIVNKKDTFTFLSFMKNRVFRILPLYWILTTFALIVFLLFPSQVNSGNENTSIVASYLLFPGNAKYLLNNGWTLSFEFYFYFTFIFYFLYTYFFKKKKEVVVVVLLVILGLIGLMFPYGIGKDFFFSSYLFEFSMGYIVYKYNGLEKKNTYLNFILIIIGIISFVIGIQYENLLSRIIIFGIPYTFIILGFIGIESHIRKYDNNIFIKLFILIGNTSYSLYLIHPFSQKIIAIIFSKIGFQNNVIFFLLTMILTSLVLGWFTYRYIEKPINYFTKNHFSK